MNTPDDNDLTSQMRPTDDEFARKLAKAHEHILQVRSAEPARTDESSQQAAEQEGLHSLVDLLQFIDRVKRPVDLTKPDQPARDSRLTSPDEAATRFDIDTAYDDGFEAPPPPARIGDPHGDEDALGCDTITIEALQQIHQIGRFRIVSQIGKGGFGLVFLAHDDRLDRDVALKIPRPEAILSLELRKRFLREAQAAAALSHPNIVTVYETGQDGPLCFLASEYVEGETLTARRQSQPGVEPKQIARWMVTLADAMQHAHSRGVLHRDLKPANVLVSNGVPRITDFGLARRLDQPIDEMTADSIVGTPAFMAPEQPLGRSGSVDARTDVYGLGGILYFLLTGEPPVQAASAIATIDAVRSRDPIPPARLNPLTPLDLQAICLKCLEKSPASRYASAHELQSDLYRFLEGRPVLARPVTTWRRTVRWSQRNPALAIAATAAVVFFAASLIATTMGWLSTTRALAGQRTANEKAERRSHDLKAAFDELFSSIERAPEVRIAGAESLRRRLLTAVNDYYEDALREQPEDTASLAPFVATINRIASLKNFLNDHQGALADVQAAIDLADQAATDSADLQFVSLRSRTILAEVLGAMGQKEKFSTASTDAIDFAQSLHDQFDEDAVVDVARAYSVLSNAAMSYGDRTLANSLSREAIQLWETVDPAKLNDEALREMLSAYFTAGSALGGSEKWEESRRVLEFSLEQAETLLENLDDAPPDFVVKVVNARRNLGSVLKSDRQQSEPHFLRALELLSYLLEQHPLISEYSVQIVRLQYAWALTDFISGRYEPANERLVANVEAADDLLVRFPTEKANLLLSKAHSLALLGYSHENLSNLDEALDALRRARDVLEQLLEITNRSFVSRLHLQGVIGGMAAIESKLGRHETAIGLLSESNSELKAILEVDPDNGECNRYLAGNLGALRSAYAKTGQWQEALAALNESMNYERELPVEHHKGQRAKIYLRLGDVANAAADYREFLNCPGETNPKDAIELARIAITFLETLDEVKKTIDPADFDALNELRTTAADSAIQRLNELRENPNVEPTHWNLLFPDPTKQSDIAEIHQWRIANSK